jgi:hypothetical protein
MTQMDTAHCFSVKESHLALDGRSSHTIIRIENFLKRFAPKGVGTFSVEIKAAMDEKDEWHTISVEPTKDAAVLKLERQIADLKNLIERNPTLGKEELAVEAAKAKITGRNSARRLLEEAGVPCDLNPDTPIRRPPMKRAIGVLEESPLATQRTVGP